MSDKSHYDYFQNTENREYYFTQWYPRQNLIFKNIIKKIKKWANILEIWFFETDFY